MSRPPVGGAEWYERAHFPRAHADARGRTRDSRGTGLAAGRGTGADFAGLGGVGFFVDLAVLVVLAVLARVGCAGARAFGVRTVSNWLATKRLKPRSQSLVRLFDIGWNLHKHAFSNGARL
jgi:hypothetical protein